MLNSARAKLAVGLLLAGVAGISPLAASMAAGKGTAKAQPSAASTFTPVPANQHVTISMVSYLPLVSPAASSTLTGLVSGFQAAHPNIHVNIQTTQGTSGGAILATVQQDLAAGNVPDVVQIGMDGVRYLALGGPGAQDLQKIAGTAGLSAEWGGDHPYPVALHQLGQANGKQYGIPWVLSTPVLFYNATLFKQAGLNPQQPPTTWTQVKTDALAIKHATGADGMATCIAGAFAGNADWCAQAVMKSAGGAVLSPDQKTLTFANARNVAAVTVLGDLGQSGALVNLSIPQVLQEFSQGKLAMALASSALQGSLLTAAQGKGIPVLAGKLPSFVGSKPSVPTNSGSALTILSRSSLNQRAAWELITYLTSDSSYTKLSENIGYAPLRTTLVSDAKYLKGWSHTQALLGPNLAQLQHLVPWQDYPGPNFAQIENLLGDAIANVMFQGANATTALGQAQSQAATLVK
jgi:multiple sugar transport system substrate-binding protein